MVGGEQGGDAGFVQRAAGRRAPVVDGDGDVEQQGVETGEVEVDDAADAHAAVGFGVPQHVVAEQVGVDRSAGQRGELDRGLAGDLGVEQGLLVGGQEGTHDLGRGRAPGGAARVVLATAVGLAGQVQAGEHGADLLAVGQAGGHLGAAGQAHHEGGRAILQGAEVFVVAVGDRAGDRQAVAREVRHQVQVVGQLGARHAFEQRQHIAAERGGDEEVAVLHAGRDALELDQAADGVVLEPVGEHGFGDGGEDGHAGSGMGR